MNNVIPILLILLLSGCGLCNQTEKIIPSSNLTNNSISQNNSSNLTNTKPLFPNNLTESEYALWQRLNVSNVEKVCLNKAKEAAGSNAWAVSGCKCVGNETIETKSYNCNLQVFDPSGTKYTAEIICKQKEKTCSIATNLGESVLTFNELMVLEK